jgi:serine/threonine protein kinase
MSDRSLTLKSIAGYCIEEALWKFVIDIVAEIQEKKYVLGGIDPDMVVIENEDFHILPKENVIPSFFAPEGKSSEAAMVWSLGALLCYASSGHLIFGGSGSLYQSKHPDVKLPALQKRHSSLTPLVQRCLVFSPEKRISMDELVIEAKKGLELCKKRVRSKTDVKVEEEHPMVSNLDERWPEEMIDNTI